MAVTYRESWQQSVSEPERFWGEQAGLVDWEIQPTQVLDRSGAPFYRWFADGTLNTCFNAVDRHVLSGRGDQPAVIYDSPVTGAQRTLTYAELLEQVRAFAGGLARLGVGYGDRVVIYMPMIPEAVVAMLACARLGAVHSVVFGGFAPTELAARIDDATPEVVIAASCGVEPSRVIPYKAMLDQALEQATHAPRAVVMFQREQLEGSMTEGRDHLWEDVVEQGRAAPADPHPVRATDPLYILYTSGTTGRPKGVVRDNGGYAVAMAWSMRNLFAVEPGEVWWAASDIGWVVGHSYIVYAPLIIGATTVVYEGKPVGTPDASAFWRVAEQHRVTGLFTAPTALRAIKREDSAGQHLEGRDLSTLRHLFLAGERLDPDTYEWASRTLGIPVVDNWWQTETGWPIATNPRGIEALQLKPGSPSVPVPGFDVRVVDGDGADVPATQEGLIVIRLPLPPGAMTTIWGDDDRFVASYLSSVEGCYLTGDGGYFDEDGYLFVLGRTDDVINVAGHRLSTGAIEAVLTEHPEVAEVAVFGVADQLKGQMPVAFVVLQAGSTAQPDEVQSQLIRSVREKIGAIATPSSVTVVTALPKTRSGKILRKTMREIADGLDAEVPATIEDASVLEQLRPLLRPRD